MSVAATLAGGFVGTVLLTSTMRAATELRLTRMDLPFLLGTAFTGERRRAKAIGYAVHFAFGLLFSLVYLAIFAALDHASWWLGGLLGTAHALFAGTALVVVLLPAVHPRMGDALTAAHSRAVIEAPGFMLLNYGRRTPLVALVAHVVYGVVVGVSVSVAG